MAHHHHHHSTQENGVKNIRTAFFLNLFFTVFEIFGGLYTNSMAIVTDALHDLGDTLSLGLAWRLHKVSMKKEDRTFSFGYRRFSLLGAVINAAILVVGSVFILMETIPRLMNPEQADAGGMILIAIFGLLVNGAAVLRLRKGKSLNERVVTIHLLEDVLGWAAVLVGSVVMFFTDLPIIDPILAAIIVAWVLFNSFRNLMKGGRIFLMAIPPDIDVEKIKADVALLDEVARVEDVHVWSMDGEYNVLSMHVIPQGITTLDEVSMLRERIRKRLEAHHVEHITIEIDPRYEKQVH